VDVIAARPPFLDSCCRAVRLARRVLTFVGCTVRLVRYLEIFGLVQTAYFSILNFVRAFSTLTRHFSISRRDTVRFSRVWRFLFVVPYGSVVILDFSGSHKPLLSSFSIFPAHSAR